MAERILTLREINRATLARQFLLERARVTPLDAIKHLVALQGQVSNAPYFGLWTRLHSFERDSLTTLLESRQVVRASSLRITLHIMAAEDYLLIHPLLQPTLSRNLHRFIGQMKDFDLDQLTSVIRAYIQERPRTGAELRAKMEEFCPGMGTPQLADALRIHMALIQPIPAGIWGFTGRPAHTEASAWLGYPITRSEGDLSQLIRRYLAAFGPAGVRDIQTWSGLTRLKPVINALRPELLTFRDEQGQELFDLPEAPRPLADTPAPVRLLPSFDNLLLSYADRRRVLSDKYRAAIFVGNSTCTTFLVDGFVRGRWKLERRSSSTTLVIEPLFEPLSPLIQNELRKEGERLMRWVHDGAKSYEIQFTVSQ